MAATGFQPAPMNADNTVRAPMVLDNDPMQRLPEKARDRLRQLRQRVEDSRALTPDFETQRELSAIRQGHQNRLDRLIASPGQGGFGLREDDARVTAQRKLAEAAADEARRVQELRDARGAKAQSEGQIPRTCEDWLMAGIPANCSLVEVPDIEVKDIVKKSDASPIAALERLKRRGREMAADLARFRAMQYPKSETLPLVRQWVEMQAQAGAPNVSGIVEHLQQEVLLADRRITAMVYNAPASAPGLAAIFTDPNAIGLIAWLLKDELIAKLEALIDAETDESAVLSTADRQVKEAELIADALENDRAVCALIWAAHAEGNSNIWFTKDNQPAAILGVRLETSTRPMQRGTSAGHSFEIAEARPPAGRVTAASPFAPGERPEWSR